VPEQERARLAFWIHQVVEYLVGGFLLVQGVQSSRPLVPALAGLGILVVAASAQAPLAAFKVVPRPLHRVVDLVALGVLVVLALTGWGGTSTPGRILLAGAAVAMAALLWRTDYRTPVKRSRRATAAPQGAPATPQPASDAPPTVEEAAVIPASSEAAAEGTHAEPSTAAEAPGASPAPAGPTKPSTAEAIGRSAGRVVGQGVNAFRNRKR